MLGYRILVMVGAELIVIFSANNGFKTHRDSLFSRETTRLHH